MFKDFNIKIFSMVLIAKGIFTYIQIYPVSEGYLGKIPVEMRGKYPESLWPSLFLGVKRKRQFHVIAIFPTRGKSHTPYTDCLL